MNNLIPIILIVTWILVGWLSWFIVCRREKFQPDISGAIMMAFIGAIFGPINLVALLILLGKRRN